MLITDSCATRELKIDKVLTIPGLTEKQTAFLCAWMELLEEHQRYFLLEMRTSYLNLNIKQTHDLHITDAGWFICVRK